jgi:Ca2+-binding RTX toxin-like protein
MLIGNAGANKLDGQGGDDTMIGGAGNDTYEVDSADDLTIEYDGGGIDQVNSSVTESLSAFVENLTLTLDGDVDGGGNTLANKIVGNSGDNMLSGGGGNDTLTGNEGDDTLVGGLGSDSMAGGAGDDLYDVDNVGDKVTDSAGIDRVNSSITYTLGANFENLKLTSFGAIDGTGNAADNDIDGNLADNILKGLAGNDSLDGAGGNDLLLGGDGDDSLSFSSGADTLVGGAGRDTFGGTAIDEMDLIMGFDPLPGGDVIDVSDLLKGFVPGSSKVEDFLSAGAGAGNTIVRVDVDGKAGLAIFVDLVLLQGVTANLDLLLASDSILGVGDSGVTPVSGGAGNDTLPAPSDSNLVFGLAGNDSLTGSSSNDWLDGGAGTDTMVSGGGTASDTYVVDSTKDVIDASGGSLNDRIIAPFSVDLTSAAYALLEHATLTGSAALNATGNASDNLLTGNAGANKLDGGASDDIMVGGAGNDTYVVDQSDDEVFELPDEGTDMVMSSASFTLSAFVENLTLTGDAVIVAVGNALANKIVGNSAANNLVGDAGNDTLTGNEGDDFLNGEAGADSMAGGTGNDAYVVDDIGDKIMEGGPASDSDEVSSAISYVLGNNLEDLLLDDAGGAINGTGNALNNAITGNDSDNVLSGLAGNDTLDGGLGDDLLLGGAGRDVLMISGGVDTLVGGADSDVFRVDAGAVSGIDVIADFNGLPGGDLIDLSDLLSGFDPNSDNINDVLRMTDDGSTIQVDPTGLGGGAIFTSVVTLQGISTDIAGLLNNGSLVLG